MVADRLKYETVFLASKLDCSLPHIAESILIYVKAPTRLSPKLPVVYNIFDTASCFNLENRKPRGIPLNEEKKILSFSTSYAGGKTTDSQWESAHVWEILSSLSLWGDGVSVFHRSSLPWAVSHCNCKNHFLCFCCPLTLFCFALFCCFVFLDRTLYIALDVLEFTMYTRVASDSEICFCLLNAGIKACTVTPHPFIGILTPIYVTEPRITCISQLCSPSLEIVTSPKLQQLKSAAAEICRGLEKSPFV